jgi:hypothetical protein
VPRDSAYSAVAIGMRYVRLAEEAHHHERYSHASALPPVALRRVIERMKYDLATDLTLARWRLKADTVGHITCG